MKIYILTMVNAWTELTYIQYFTTLEKAQSVMKSQVDEELQDYEEDETVRYGISKRSAYLDDGEFDDREKYSWKITEMDI